MVVQILTYCLQDDFNYEKVLKLAKDSSDGVSDIKGAIAAVHFMLTNSAKFDLDEKSLVQEIQQLGLPKENTEAISKLYREQKDNLREKFAENSYRVSKLLSADWRVDQIISSSSNESGPLIHLNLTVNEQPEKTDLTGPSTVKEIAFELSETKLNALIHELSQVQALMESVEN